MQYKLFGQKSEVSGKELIAEKYTLLGTLHIGTEVMSCWYRLWVMSEDGIYVAELSEKGVI